MIYVKLFGLLRLESGVKELQIEASNMEQVYDAILQKSETITRKDLEGCLILINGNKGGKKSKLHEGDTVTLMSPVAGG